jgi:RsiW-degrading membrane proteinase PrsW (M82 family)
VNTPPTTTADRPHWGEQASLFQIRQPAFWLFMVLLAIGALIFIDQQSAMSQLPQAWGLSWLLVVLYAIPVAFVVYRVDLFEREPRLLLAAAVIFGGVIATSMALYANEAWLSVMGKIAPLDVTADWGPAFIGPGVEETLKLMGVVLIFLIVPHEFDGLMDGFVYGAMVGLGFTVAEDVSYFVNAVALGGAVDQTGPVWDTFLIRVVGGGLYGHVLFTGLTGLGFAYIVTKPRLALARRLVGGGLCILAGYAAHLFWNSPLIQTVLATEDDSAPSTFQWVLYGLCKGMPFLLLLALLVFFATRSEEATYRSIVAGEPSDDVVSDAEARSLRSLWARRSARAAAGRAHGPSAGKLTGNLQAAQIEYAMVRSRVDSLTDPALEAQRQRIRLIRHQLAPLLGAGAPRSSPHPSPQATGPATPAPTAKPAAAAKWAPTHLVPPTGMAAWAAPDPAQRPLGMLPAGLELVVESTAGAWAQVRAINGWRGWVDGRILAARK